MLERFARLDGVLYPATAWLVVPVLVSVLVLLLLLSCLSGAGDLGMARDGI